MYVMTNTCLSQHMYACCNKTFVMTNIFLLWNLVATKLVMTNLLLSQQRRVCHDKTQLLSWQTHVCHDKYLLQQKFCCGKNILQQKFCRSKHTFVVQKMCFDTTNMCLLQQTRVCCDKTFVATKIILVAAPASDTEPVPPTSSEPVDNRPPTLKNGNKPAMNLPVPANGQGLTKHQRKFSDCRRGRVPISRLLKVVLLILRACTEFCSRHETERQKLD